MGLLAPGPTAGERKGGVRVVRAGEGIAACRRPWQEESWRGSAGRAPR